MAPAPAYETNLGQITGRYAMVDVAGAPHRYYYETAGTGDPPILFLHTAGADSRQYLWQMADAELARRFRLFAPDMPYHGRSMPPEAWDGAPYHLTAARYEEWVSAFIEQIVGAPPLLIGGLDGRRNCPHHGREPPGPHARCHRVGTAFPLAGPPQRVSGSCRCSCRSVITALLPAD